MSLACLYCRTAGFPRSGLKPWPIFRGPSQLRRGLSAGSRTPRYPWLPHSLVPPPASAYRRLCVRPPRGRRNRQVSRAPLPEIGVTENRGDMDCLLRGRYSPVVAPTGSCANPFWLSPPSAIASFEESLQVATGPCCQRDLPDVISVNPSCDAWAPTTTVGRLHAPVSSSASSAFPNDE